MKQFGLMICLATSLACTVSLYGQAVKRDAPPYPPEPADRSIVTDQQQRVEKRTKVDKAQMERDARELSDIAQSLPADIGRVNQGILPKDVNDKLKKIEKLAKHLRSEIGP